MGFDGSRKETLKEKHFQPSAGAARENSIINLRYSQTGLSQHAYNGKLAWIKIIVVASAVRLATGFIERGQIVCWNRGWDGTRYTFNNGVSAKPTIAFVIAQ
jgi:hypothetical protein